MKTDQGVAEVQYGTLDVAVASRKAIVVATDSRRSGYDEARTDDTKKLFLLPGDRVVAIAGLVDASLPKFPEITAQIPALLEQAIGHCGHLDMFFWEDPPPPADSPEEFHHLWGSDPFVWLSAIVGPIQTVFNIAATYSPVDLSRATMDVIVAGYRQSGEVKLVRSRLQPLESTPRGGRRFIGVARHHERVAPVDGFAATTIGAGNLANALLFEAVPVDFIPELSSYPGIEAFLERRDSGDLAEMPEDDLIALAHDLIRATAASNRGVGSEPLQTAVLRFGQRVAYDQPITSAGTIVLPGDGAWHMGGVFTPDSDYPFATQNRGAVFTDCEVSGNQSPIPLGDNLFFGSRFINAVFHYDGGRVMFDNNKLDGCELRLAAGCPVDPSLKKILNLFLRVVQE